MYSQQQAHTTIPIPTNCKAWVSCPKIKILITTVNIFLVVITKGTTCCLNYLISLYTKSCPVDDKTVLISISLITAGLSIAKVIVSNNLPVQTEYIKVSTKNHLLICSNIQVGSGLYSDFIIAWKSGKNPSTTKEIANRKIPNSEEAFQVFFMSPPKLYSRIPSVTKQATIILFPPSFNDFCLTPEQHTPTITTETMLQDFTIITIGKGTIRC